MPSHTKSNQRGVDRRKGRHRANTRSGHEGAEHQIPILSEFCAVCFLTFGSQEKRVFEGDKVAHSRCERRLRSG